MKMSKLDIYSAKKLGKLKRKFCIVLNMEDLLASNANIVCPESVDDISDTWQLFDYGYGVDIDQDNIDMVLGWINPMISEIRDHGELENTIKNAVYDCIRLKIESNIYNVWMNSLDNVYLEFCDQDTGKPLISDLENWYSEGSINFYLSDKQVREYLRLKQLNYSDFDNDQFRIEEYIQEQSNEKEYLNNYSFDICYHEWLEDTEEDKDQVLQYLMDYLNKDIVIFKGDKGEQLTLEV